MLRFASIIFMLGMLFTSGRAVWLFNQASSNPTGSSLSVLSAETTRSCLLPGEVLTLYASRTFDSRPFLDGNLFARAKAASQIIAKGPYTPSHSFLTIPKASYALPWTFGSTQLSV
ncbi:hypothetical protein I308_106055 [Cryptococcus tetragattii IND107]|uniref:Uncharacterized protein n=1 Tax=Cryptococcus tetragattii IND107 TaxID=1296105 RepID=A0ABR3BKE0_9TREE